MDRERLDRWVEWGILGLLLAVLGYSPLVFGAVRPQEFIVVMVMVLGIISIWLIRLWISPAPRLLWTPACWGVLAFMLYALVQYWRADIEYVARQEVVRVLIYGTLFFVTLFHLHRQENTQIVTLALITLAFGISAYAIYQFATDSEKVWHLYKPVGYARRSTGTYICPNHLAGFLELILPLGLSLTLVGRVKPLTRILVGYATLVIIAGFGTSISRGGWIATGLSLIFLFGMLLRYRSYRLPAIAAILILVALGTTFVWNTRHTRKRFRDMLVSGNLEDIRFRLWQPAVQMSREDPWWGMGPGHYDYRFRQYRPEDIQMRPDRVHNDYLNTLVDWGIVGVILVASAWALLGWGVAKTWKFVHHQSGELSSRPSNRFTFVLGASTGLLALLLHSVVDFNLHIPANAILAVVLMAMLSSHLRFTTNRYWFSLRWLGRGLTSLVLLGAMAALAIQAWRSHGETQLLLRAEKARDFSPEKLALLRQAFAVEPKNFATAYQIGEALRMKSWLGEESYEELAKEAMTWYEKAIKLHPFDAYSYMRYGMCLDWVGEFEQADPYFQKALALDPNGYYMSAHQGWHLIQKNDYVGAKPWFERSLKLKPLNNPIAASYLAIVNRRISESESNTKTP